MAKKNNLEYKPQEIEAKWREIWTKQKTFQVDIKTAKKPYFNLMMFPYPSAEGLHVGNMYAFTGSDIWGRYMRLKGCDVLEPIGLDGFGIHSENYAIKLAKHPVEQAKISEANFYRQLKSIGNQFSWDNHLETYDPEYYKWTQWIFVQMFKAGLAYRKKATVNWCPSCKTVLADEQVIDGKCERCESVVEQKDLEQWFFKITKYAGRLLDNCDKIDWSTRVLTAQRNWIGRSEGINISYKIVDKHGRHISAKNSRPLSVTCFTTRPDTNFGATFVVMSPENPSLEDLKQHMPQDVREEVEKYILAAKQKSKEERISEGREKTGVFTGLYCLNHLTNKPMPLWVSDFVLMDVGTGVVVGVPGHDIRDFEFSQKFGLEVLRVVVGKDGDKSAITKPEQVQEEEGTMINSGFLNGMDIHKATYAIMDYLEKQGWGTRTVHYHLRDWLISRQRYWGPPIPMINCPKCGWQAVPEDQLPVILPYVKEYRPKGTGRGPLAQLKEWLKVKCPKCGGPAERETDVSDTFLDSAWYFLRYPSVAVEDDSSMTNLTRFANRARKNSKPSSSHSRDTVNAQTLSNLSSSLSSKSPAWNPEITKKWLPVNMYIGGAEHSVLHLLYSRFVTMFFHDLGLLDFEEPFTKFRAHGLIIKDGFKMSKSKGNIVNPDEYIAKYGADALRCYLMFLGPLADGGDFRDTGMVGMFKFLARVWRLIQDSRNKIQETKNKNHESKIINHKSEVYWQHKTIKRVTEGIERLKYNTSLAAIMEFINFLKEQKEISKEALKTLLILLAPFAPHMTEELWQQINSQPKSIHNESWPQYDGKYIKEDVVEIVVQVNGKLRDRLTVEQSNNETMKQVILEKVKTSARLQPYLQGKTIKKTIFIPGKLVNLVL